MRNLAASLTHSKRLEDKLGPTEVLDTVLDQHGIVRRLLAEGVRSDVRQPLLVVDSNMATAIGGYLIDMGDHDGAQRYFQRARKAGHNAHNPSCTAYAAANMSFSAFLRDEAHTALDSAAAARSLAARTDDTQPKGTGRADGRRRIRPGWPARAMPGCVCAGSRVPCRRERIQP
ncbi:MAG: hypothetical protein ACRDTG_23050 [Pseudonocardiaceae bacterium]